MRVFNSAEAFYESFPEVYGLLGFTNGCFDIIHPGHIRMLEKAKSKVDFLVVGLNSDESVTRLKGWTRPYMRQEDRATVLAGLRSVDAVVIFNEDTPLELITKLQPDLILKGSDYNLNDVVGKDYVEGYGGKAELIGYQDGQSSTYYLNRINCTS